MASLKVTFLGHASFRFESDAETVVYYDPWLTGNPVAAITLDDVKRADIVVVSHGHNDHIRDAFDICARTRATLVCGNETSLVATRYGMQRDKDALPLNPGGSVRVADVRVRLVQAVHASGSLSPNLKLGAPVEMRTSGQTAAPAVSS